MDLFFIREVEEDQQLNEMMKNLGKHPSESIIPSNIVATSFQHAPFIYRSKKSQTQKETLHLKALQTKE